jgi:hypothetical protein
MSIPRIIPFLAALSVVWLSHGDAAAEPAPKLVAGSTFTVTFAEMPPTFFNLTHPDQKTPAQMTVFLPRNYSADRKFPLLVFLEGGDGGDGSHLGVARALCEGKDFVCLGVPLFRTGDPHAPGKYVLREPDGRFMWPYFRTMLAKLDTQVTNLDSAHQILCGFSNGAHAIAALIDGSEGEVARRFSAIGFVEGGGHLEHYEQLKGKPFLMVSSQPGSKRRALEILDTAKAAGAIGTFVFQDVGQHDFPQAAYPAVREWLRGEAAAPRY